MALDVPELGLFPVFYSKIGACENPNFRDAGMAAALLDKWIIDYMTDQKMAVPDSAIVIGQSAGGWGAIALSSQNLSSVKAIITFAAGRGGRVGGKPNNNCAPDKLVDATAEFGRTRARRCSGSISRTTLISDLISPSGCMRPTPGPAEAPNII